MKSLIALCLFLTPAASVLALGADPAQEAAIKQLGDNGASVRVIAQGDDRLLIDFHLSGDGFEDSKLAPAAKLQNVYEIHLGGTALTDAGLAHISGLTSTERLHLENTKISDAGLEHISGFENLQYLNVYGTAISDAGLEHLIGLAKLRKLYLWQTKVTDAGVARLQKALPELAIDRGWDLDEQKN